MSELSAPFTDMASRLELNAGQGFGGAFVIVPPGTGDEEPKPHVLLMLNNADNPAMFWAALQTTAQIALQEIAKAEEGLGFIGGRR
jgi:hypothetical protein